jgi:phosphoglycolate phosphatase
MIPEKISSLNQSFLLQEVPIMSKKLLLFDIDGTLVRVEGMSRISLIEALRSVYGTEGSAATHNFSGKMDSVIISEVMREAGLSDAQIANGFDEAKKLYIDNFKSQAEKNHVRVMSGVIALLEELHKHPGVVLALLTGNFEESGRHKLILPDINHYFPFGAFADDAPTRNQLPPVAVERAKSHTGIDFKAKEVVIIGDTEHDVNCAKVLSSKSIAVATGYYSADALRSYYPDHVFENFSDTKAVLEAIFS